MVWGLPLAPLTLEQSLEAIDAMIAEGEPRLIITANLNYAMLSAQNDRLRQANAAATLILADGMPLVWASRREATPEQLALPERVAGSDLVPALCSRAAERGHRIFLLGAALGVAATAADKLRAQFPQIQIVGIEAPPFRALTAEEHEALVARVREARPDLLFVAFGQPRGELWIHDNLQQLGVPVQIQVGATIDFLAGRVRRAPRWIQAIGMEWAFRLALEPRRLFQRYFQNALFLIRTLVREHRSPSHP